MLVRRIIDLYPPFIHLNGEKRCVLLKVQFNDPRHRVKLGHVDPESKRRIPIRLPYSWLLQARNFPLEANKHSNDHTDCVQCVLFFIASRSSIHKDPKSL